MRAPRMAAVGVGLTLAVVAVVVVRRRAKDTSRPAASRCIADLRDISAPPPASGHITYVWHVGKRDGFPVVRAAVGGCDVTVLLDTGVPGPMLLPWLADRLRIARTRTAMTAVDLGARARTIDSIAPGLFVDSPDVAIATPVDLVLGDDGLRRYGIGAIAPPQFLVPATRVSELDFLAGTYRTLAPGESNDRHPGPPTFAGVDDCDGTFVVSGHVRGIAAKLRVDTGSPITAVYERTDAGRALAGTISAWNEVPVDAGFGNGQTEQIEPDVPVSIGNLAGRMWVDVFRGDPPITDACRFDGVLGTDFLIDRGCALLFDAGDIARDAGALRYTRLRAYCRP